MNNPISGKGSLLKKSYFLLIVKSVRKQRFFGGATAVGAAYFRGL